MKNLLNKITTPNILCFLIFSFLAVITVLAILRSLDILRELIVAWISAASAVTAYLFKQQKYEQVTDDEKSNSTTKAAGAVDNQEKSVDN